MKYYSNHNSSIFIHLTMSNDIAIVSYLNDWHKTLTSITVSHKWG